MDFDTWSQSQFAALKGDRETYSQQWEEAMRGDIDLLAEADEKKLVAIADSYTQYLHTCKDNGLHWVHRVDSYCRVSLRAPVLQFFPCAAPEGKFSKTSNYAVLKARYEEYQQKVVKAFYKNHFATFDRQIVLVDCLPATQRGL
ncbi:YcjX family protein [Vibrio lentus]|nr:YcjX family protein [Vibrio lentus]